LLLQFDKVTLDGLNLDVLVFLITLALIVHPESKKRDHVLYSTPDIVSRHSVSFVVLVDVKFNWI
jgi:hypothetical protein